MYEIFQKRLSNEIVRWNIQDIYAISIYIYNRNDNPLEPVVMLGYNTEEKVKESLLETEIIEARWNYAYWLQNDKVIIGDKETANNIKKWMGKRGFLDLVEDEVDEFITIELEKELAKYVKNIHEQRILTEVFGREIPIIIHELEYYEDILELNIDANGSVLPNEFGIICK